MQNAAGLILNRQNGKAVRCAERAAEIFRTYGVTTFDPQREKTALMPDFILTFGGDGTLLTGFRYALEYDCPLMGVGRLPDRRGPGTPGRSAQGAYGRSVPV